MNDEEQPFVGPFNEAIDEVEVFLWITRDSDLQRECIRTISALQSQAADLKKQAVEAKNESVANLLLGYERVFAALSAEINMYLLLKSGDPDSAWDSLVTVQMSIADALRAHSAFSYLTRKLRRLDAIEHIFFPPQVFVSTGMIVKRQNCSICSKEYEDCDHLIGRPYLGEICSVVVQDCEVDHVAVVDDPADKGCRALSFSTDEGMRNRMTWRVEPYDDQDPAPEAQRPNLPDGPLLRVQVVALR